MSNSGNVQVYQTSGPNWRVTGAVQTTAQAANGQFARGWEVTYQLDTGHTGTVFLPTNQFNPDSVKAAVAADAAQLYQVVNLTNQS